MYCLKSHTPEETQKLGLCIGKLINPAFSIALTGDLGAGKTCFVQGLARGLGVDESYYITSPTYGILNEYPSKKGPLWHMDLYRLGSPEELDFLGMDRMHSEPVIMAAEWPNFLLDQDFFFNLKINFRFDAHDIRTICISATGQKAQNLLGVLSSTFA